MDQLQQEGDADSLNEKVLREKSQELEQKIRQAAEKKNHMQQAMNSVENRHKIINALKQAQREGILKGVHGRLGDLGTIDDRFDVAVSTASAHLDFIVVETIKDGEDCMNYLKQHRLGRASFACMDKIG